MRRLNRTLAGIGFELKKLFSRRGLLATFRAYGYAGVITAGPMLLSVVLLLGVMFLSDYFGLDSHSRELGVSMITYSLLGSLIATSFFSMVVTRYVADMLYEEQLKAIMPSFWGSSSLMLVFGCLCYGIFLAFAGASFVQSCLCMMLFAEMIVIWNAMSYLTAIKSYRGLMCSFAAAVAVAFGVCWLLMKNGHISVETIMFSVCVGYGVMLCWDVVLLQRYFPQSDLSPWTFLRWIDKFLRLAFSGLFVHIGLFSHLVIIWCSPIRVQVQGLFYGAPAHDVAALTAFITILVTTINFVVSVEVNFYPKYRAYVSLYNDKGNVGDILKAERDMLDVLKSQILYTAIKQLCVTTLSIALCELILDNLPLGFTDLMYGYFRMLSIGYGLYTLGNVMMLLLLYFTDYSGALACTALFAAAATGLTIASLRLPEVYYGVGFVGGAMVFYVASLLRLSRFTRRLPYHILARQPIVAMDKRGVFTKLCVFLERSQRRKMKHAE